MQRVRFTFNRSVDVEALLVINIRVISPNSGCLLNIGNGPQSGQPLYSKPKGRDAAHQFITGPMAAKWLIIVYTKGNGTAHVPC